MTLSSKIYLVGNCLANSTASFFDIILNFIFTFLIRSKSLEKNSLACKKFFLKAVFQFFKPCWGLAKFKLIIILQHIKIRHFFTNDTQNTKKTGCNLLRILQKKKQNLSVFLRHLESFTIISKMIPCFYLSGLIILIYNCHKNM